VLVLAENNERLSQQLAALQEKGSNPAS